MPICIHCEIYNNIPESLRKTIKISDKRTIHTRFCTRSEKEMSPDEDGCENFLPYPFFYCDKFKYRLHLLQCLNRKRLQLLDCRRCTQVENIIDVARGRDLYRYFEVPRKIHRPRIKRATKPVLKRNKA